MKVMKLGKEESYEDFYTDQYEFRLCGGSIEPDDKKELEETSKSEKEA